MIDKLPSNDRRVLSTRVELAAAVARLALGARRSLAIFSRDLAPALYDRLDFLDAVRQLVLTQRVARVRIIVIDAGPAVRRGHRLIETTRKLSSYIEIRSAHADYTKRNDDFLVADARGFVYRTDATRYEGVVDDHGGRIARRYLAQFDEMWEKSTGEPEFRRMRL